VHQIVKIVNQTDFAHYVNPDIIYQEAHAIHVAQDLHVTAPLLKQNAAWVHIQKQEQAVVYRVLRVNIQMPKEQPHVLLALLYAIHVTVKQELVQTAAQDTILI